MKPSDWISLGSAGVTLILAIIATRQLVLSQRAIKVASDSAKATEKSATATEESVRIMKEAQRPHFDVTMGYEQGLATLTIHNFGSGAGIIRLLTMRKDIMLDSIFYPLKYRKDKCQSEPTDQALLEGFVINPKQEITFYLTIDSQFKSFFIPNGDTQLNVASLSSISIFYDDVYSQTYRARTLYTIKSAVNAPDSQKEVTTIHKENYTDKLPKRTPRCFDAGWYNRFEGDIPVVYRSLFLVFHKLKAVNSVRGIKLKGTEYTKNEEVTFKDVTFESNGFPQFLLKVRDHPSFVLIFDEHNGIQEAKVLDEDKGVISHKSAYGLFIDSDERELALTLYRQVSNELKAHLVNIY